MPILQHLRWWRRLFQKGANRDVRPELLSDGYYTDAQNMRPTSISGNAGGLEAIDGEVRLSGAFLPNGQPIPNASTYVLIGSAYTNGHAVEFWASTDPANAPLIRIDGIVMAQSPNIPYRYDRPLQIAVVDQCRSGVLYPADDFNDPLFWDIQAIITAFNNNTGQFFNGFNVSSVLVGLNAPPSFPVLDREEPLIDLGTASGLPVGQYAYCIRWVTANGDRTNWGPETPLIAVPAKLTPAQPLTSYPGMPSYGGEANVQVPTPYAINLRIRIDNQFGYSSIEIKRRRYNNNEGLSSPGYEEIVGRIELTPGQLNIIRFKDNPDAFEQPEPIGSVEAQNQLVNIKKPKAVDYADGRLKYGNFELENQDIGAQLTFREVDGRKMTSITKALRKRVVNPDTGLTELIPDGYTNPYNATYYKSARRGEKYGYGIQCWDGLNGKYPAVNIPGLENYAHPNRRDIKGANGNWGVDSAASPVGYSDDPIYAANVDVTNATAEGPVGQTFDVMTQGTKGKSDTNSLVNVMFPNESPSLLRRQSNQFYSLNNSNPQNAGVDAVTLNGVDWIYPDNASGYAPWRPTGNNDNSNSGYEIPPDVAKFVGFPGAGGNGLGEVQQGLSQHFPGVNQPAVRGLIFAPTTQALGGLLYGVENIPSSVNAFTVARTPPAGRVIMQGLGSYCLEPVTNETPLGYEQSKKRLNSIYVHFPEDAAGIINQVLIEQLLENPGRYLLQFVAPYGFYTEHYGFHGVEYPSEDIHRPWADNCYAAWGLDMISYARIMYENGTVNAGEPTSGIGVHPVNGNAPDTNYVGFDKWRALESYTPNSPFQTPDGGNVLLGMTNITPIQLPSQRGSYYKIDLEQSVYELDQITPRASRFDADVTRRFHQPWYVVNIVDTNAEPPNSNIVDYVNTGCHIKMRSCIGIYTGGGTAQEFELLDERWQDCSNRFPTDYRYVYVQKPDGQEERWLNFYSNTQVDLTAIINSLNSTGEALLPNGVIIYGLCESVDPGLNLNPVAIRIGDPTYGPPPEDGSRIIVRYDPTAPIEVFGHDIAVAPSTHAIYDYSFQADAITETFTTEQLKNGALGFPLGGLPLPHTGFASNPRWYIPRTVNESEQNIVINFMHTIRQWCIMWDAETKLQPQLYVNATSTPNNREDQSQFFPAVHYVARLYKWNGGSIANGEPWNQYPSYNVDYQYEYPIASLGGLRFSPTVNFDYAKQPDIDFKGYPLVGYAFNGDFCTGIIASTEFDPLNQDSPGLRTFLYQNLTNISNENGEIKLLATALGPRGQNQYAFTQKGVCLVLTNKNVLTGASGEQIATQSISNYWGEELWITRNIGLPDQFWRLFCKGHAPAGEGFVDTFFWPDRRSWYRLRGDSIQDIIRSKYLSKVEPVLRSLPSDYTPQMSAFYNPLYHEVWNSFRGEDFPDHFWVYSALNDEWTGGYTYNFDGYLSTPNGNLGMRNCETFQLDSSQTISGFTREAWVMYPLVGDPGSYKEAVRSRIVGDKPDAMELYDKNMNLMSRQSFAAQEAFAPGTGNLWIKRYDSWELFWNRVSTAYNAARPRPQDELFFVKIIYNTRGSKIVTMGENQLQNIK